MQEQETATPPAAVTVVQPSAMANYQPTGIQGAFKLAGDLAASKIVPRELQGDPAAVFSIMARGELLGLHWSVSVQTLYVVHGRVGLPAEIMAGICAADPEFEYFEVVEATNEKATVEAKKVRWQEPRRHTVTIEDAVRAGYLDGKHSALWGRLGRDGKPDPNCQHRRVTMLRHMAEREAARMWNQKTFAGLTSRDEMVALGDEHVIPAISQPLDGAALMDPVEATGSGRPGNGDLNPPMAPADVTTFKKALKKKGDDVLAELCADIGRGPEEWRAGDAEAINAALR